MEYGCPRSASEWGLLADYEANNIHILEKEADDYRVYYLINGNPGLYRYAFDRKEGIKFVRR